MRLFANDDTIKTPVRWFFLDDDVQTLPYPNMFTSANWRDRFDEWPILGEVAGSPREWVDGSGPAAQLSRLPCGPKTAWAEGEAEFTGPLTDVLEWGIPSACSIPGARVCPDLGSLGVRHPSVMYALAVGIAAVSAGVMEDLEDVLVQLIGPSPTIADLGTVGPTDLHACAAWSLTQCLVLLAGSRTDAQVYHQIVSSQAPLQDMGGFKFSVAAAAIADRALQRMYAAGMPTNLPLTLAGYSLGGSVASYVTARERQLRPARRVQCLTFGEPKAGDADFAKVIRGVHTRVERDFDAVPYIPPDFGILGWIASFFDLNTLLRWARFKRSSAGFHLGGDGSFVPADAQGILAGDLVPLLEAMIAGGVHFPFSEHLLRKYVLDLHLRVGIKDTTLPACELSITLVEDLWDRIEKNLMDVRYATTCDVYRAAHNPPAAPDVAAVPIDMFGSFFRRTESGEGDTAAGHYTHTIDFDLAVDIRDDYNEGTPGANRDHIYVPDKTGTQFVVRFVERREDESSGPYKRAYLDRKTPNWPTDAL